MEPVRTSVDVRWCTVDGVSPPPVGPEAPPDLIFKDPSLGRFVISHLVTLSAFWEDRVVW